MTGAKSVAEGMDSLISSAKTSIDDTENAQHFAGRFEHGATPDQTRIEGVPVSQLKTTQVHGHAGLLAQPAYEKLLAAEPWLKRVIPALIISFLAIIGFARSVQLIENRDTIVQHGKENLTLIADMVEHNLARLPENVEQQQLPNLLMAHLADALPVGATRGGRIILLTNNDGRILAEAPLSGGYRGTYLSDSLLQTQAMMTFGRRAGIQEVGLVATGKTALATVRHLPHGYGAMAVFQTKSSLLQDWRADISLNVSIFIGTCILMVVVLYGYFSQASRADEADRMYHETYARFDTALTHGKCGLWDWDVARQRLFWSPSMYEILGMTPRQTLIGYAEVDRLIHPEDLNLFSVAQNMFSTGNHQVDQHFRMRHENGSWVWVRARGEQVINQTTGAPHLVGICIDVTEQKRLEEENKNANERLRDSVDSFSEAFALWDADNKLTICNQEYRELYGLSRSSAHAGTSYRDVVQVANTEGHTLHPILDQGSSVADTKDEIRQIHDQWVQVSERRTQDGGFVSIGTNISTVKQQQAALKEREIALESSIANLKTSQANLRKMANQYAEKTKLANEASHAKSQFMANISHEWRTPLNAILGFSEVMQSEVFGPLGSDKYQEYIHDIHDSGKYMMSFINDIIDMSEIEEGEFKLEPEEVNLGLMLQDAFKASELEAAQNKITIECCKCEDAFINADRRSVKLILHNLVSNAVKFSKEDGVVEIQCSQTPKFQKISIADNGIGIPENALKKLGRPFEQVQNQFTKNHQGSGLGLAIARSLVEMHGGKLQIDSKLGKGTTVIVELPRSA